MASRTPERIVVASPGPRTCVDTTRAPVIEPPYVLGVGSITPRKNFHILAESARLLPADAPPIVIAGPDGWRAKEVRQQISALGLGDRVRLLGRVDDATLDALYLHASRSVPCESSRRVRHPLPRGDGTRCPRRRGRHPISARAGRRSPRARSGRRSRGAGDSARAVLRDPGRQASMSTAGRLRSAEFSWEKMTARIVDSVSLGDELTASRAKDRSAIDVRRSTLRARPSRTRSAARTSTPSRAPTNRPKRAMHRYGPTSRSSPRRCSQTRASVQTTRPSSSGPGTGQSMISSTLVGGRPLPSSGASLPCENATLAANALCTTYAPPETSSATTHGLRGRWSTHAAINEPTRRRTASSRTNAAPVANVADSTHRCRRHASNQPATNGSTHSSWSKYPSVKVPVCASRSFRRGAGRA